MDKDEKLLTTFFAEHRQEIPDNGFSRRVMHRLPDRTLWLSRLWTGFCFTLAVVLFVVLDGAQLLIDSLRETFDAALQHGAAAELDPKTLAIAAVVLILLGYRKIASLA